MAAAKPKPEPTPEPTPDPTPEAATPTVEVRAVDHAAAEKSARAKAEREHAAALRAQHVEGLRNELAYLERQPAVDKARVTAVHKELDRYSDEPSGRDVEKA